MTHEELNIKMAEIRGWIHLGSRDDLVDGNGDPHPGPVGFRPEPHHEYCVGQGPYLGEGSSGPVFGLPKYVRDLNAVRDVLVNGIGEFTDAYFRFPEELRKIILEDTKCEIQTEEAYILAKMISASAEQQCLAILRAHRWN